MLMVRKWVKKGSAEIIWLSYICIIISVIFLHMVAFITYSKSCNSISNALTVASRAAAICDSAEDAKKRAETAMDSAITDPNVRNAEISIMPVGPSWEWKGGKQAKIVLDADVRTLTPYMVGGNVRKSQLITIEGNIELDFAHIKPMPYDPFTPRSEGQVRQLIAFAKYWLDKGLTYGSNWDGNDPNNKRWEKLSPGGISDCSWFLYHVLELFGYVPYDGFIHSYEWGNNPELYPGGQNIGSDIRNASPGDIICSGGGTASSNSHVALYIGGGKVIEMTPAGLKISNAGTPREIVHFKCNPYNPM